MSNASGHLSLTDGTVVYRADDVGWSIKLADVRLIGEYTNANGPYVDDYFFVFMTAREDGWYEASFYAAGRDAFFSDLTDALGSPIETGLCNSAEYKTRILWPPQVVGQPLTEVVPKDTATGRIWAKIAGRQDVKLSNAAESIFEARGETEE